MKTEVPYPNDFSMLVKIVVFYPAVGFFILVSVGLFVLMRTQVNLESDSKQWPAALQHALRSDLTSTIVYAEIQQGVDFGGEQRSFAKISGRTAVNEFIAFSNLQSTRSTHPRIDDFLQAQARLGWSVTSNSIQWYSTPGFGSEHQEGVDLYLLQTNEAMDEALVYRYWVF